VPDGGHSQTTELLEETPPLLLRGGYFFMYTKIPKITVASKFKSAITSKIVITVTPFFGEITVPSF